MSLIPVIILAIVQGLAELLPVSSSAHLVIAAKLLGLDPTTPEMTVLIVMLHTGTMFAVIIYFWKRWKARLQVAPDQRRKLFMRLAYATFWTGVVGYPLMKGIEYCATRAGLGGTDAQGHLRHADVELIFGNLPLIAAALAVVGILILVAGLRRASQGDEGGTDVASGQAGWIGAIQGLCLPFRGFSRSGATISTGLLLGVSRAASEEFSFALAVILTPPVIAREVWRLVKEQHPHLHPAGPLAMVLPCLLGMAASFLAGLIALRWLSGWLERGRWHYFGIYCLVAAAAVAILHVGVY